ncbi:MAG: tetratricopeptide repeat protein [Planctomycetota bacterium]
MPRRRFARLRLTATTTEPLALGAIVSLTAGGVTQQDYVRITDGFMTQVPRELHFGIGNADKIDRITVRWPGGNAKVYSDIPADRLVEIREDEAAPKVSELPAWPEATRPKARPSFSFETALDRLAGGKAPLATTGKPAVVNFWSPTCAPCKEELPRLAALAREFGDRVQFAGVSAESKDLESVRKSVADFGVPYPQFLANEAFLKSFFGTGDAILPSTFVFDGAGRLRQSFHRAISQPELAALLESFREESVAAADLVARGSALIQSGDFEAAARFLHDAVKADPESSAALNQLGTALSGVAGSIESGKTPAADAAEAERRRQQAIPKWEEAIVWLQRAVALDADFSEAQYNLGVALQRTGRYEAAIKALEEALRVVPNSYDSLYSLGMSAGAARQNALAGDAFERAIVLAPRRPEAWVGKGLWLRQIGKMEEAKSALQKAVELDPSNEEARGILQGMP